MLGSGTIVPDSMWDLEVVHLAFARHWDFSSGGLPDSAAAFQPHEPL